ncbi:kinase-like protein [Saccharata proteae CBS 121410]|uniref:Kinase-like protein n=1 Tax=Saccharata proteae CBS 121410 TaxID=1314787 RepID=A0A9P4HU66_9PEZI|nr:kinase-like protein [Saccharata proteae CBS 121410]
MAASQPNHDPNIQRFHAHMNSARIRGSLALSSTEQKWFIPFPKVEEYMKDDKKILNILRVLWPNSDVPIQPAAIRKGYSRIFCILLSVELGAYIKYFSQYDSLRDDLLPFVSEPAQFPKAPTRNLFESFRDAQWELCAPRFDGRLDVQYEPDRILPIIKKEKLGEGASAHTYKIILYSWYNQLHGRRQEYRFADTFVVKSFRGGDAEEHYNNEKRAFEKLAMSGPQVQSIIGFYGSFFHDGIYNIILEFADKGTLEDYLAIHRPPQRGSEIIEVWRGMFQLILAILAIHEAGNLSDSSDARPSFRGWHQDVKPANILVCGSDTDPIYKWKFKLADMGLSHFKRATTADSDEKSRDNYGTRTYCAPECYRSSDSIGAMGLGVSQRVDLWSLGCIFSEVAVWIVEGFEGLEDYRLQRREATSKIPGFEDSGCTHDGEEVLGTVLDKHESLCADKRNSDIITKGVIRIVENDMLVRSGSRPSAKVLWDKSDQLLHQAQKPQFHTGPTSRSTSGIDIGQNIGERQKSPPSSLYDQSEAHPKSSSQLSMVSRRRIDGTFQRRDHQPRQSSVTVPIAGPSVLGLSESPDEDTEEDQEEYSLCQEAKQHAASPPGRTGEKAIKQIVDTLCELRASRGQLGIQFISFGNDQKRLDLLQHLDSGLKLRLDIVDTTPSNEDVWKMLLGAIEPLWDNDQ